MKSGCDKACGKACKTTLFCMFYHRFTFAVSGYEKPFRFALLGKLLFNGLNIERFITRLPFSIRWL